MPLAVVVNRNGNPEPPTEVVRRLQRVDPGFGLRWAVNQWQLTRRWPENDRRWRWVQEQSYSPDAAFDIVGHIPNDCAADQVPAYVERLVREWPVADARGLLERMTKYNENPEAVQRVVETVAEEVVEAVVAPTRKRGRRTKVTPKEG